MRSHLIAAGVLCVCATVPAGAQSDGAVLPAVDTLNCEQMTAELMVAGQTMSGQLDPEFATEAQAMHDEMTGANAAAAAGMPAGAAATAACAAGVPGACAGLQANQRAQAAAGMTQAADHQARMAAQMGRLQASTAGLDMARMMALSERFESQGCQTPQ